jgi:type II secretory pathway pseudopilin PulG
MKGRGEMKKNGMKNWHNSKILNGGITLIALVVTIIVLLILAGVTINTLFGENGILTQAQGSKDETNQAEVKETVSLYLQEYKLASYDETSDAKEQDVIEWMVSQNYIIAKNDYYVLDSTKSKADGDVYVVEKYTSIYNTETASNVKVASTVTSDVTKSLIVADEEIEEEEVETWVLGYYKTANDPNPIALLRFTLTGTIMAITNVATDSLPLITNPTWPDGTTAYTGSITYSDDGQSVTTDGLVWKDENDNEWVWIIVPRNQVFTAEASTYIDENDSTEYDYTKIRDALITWATDYRNSSYNDYWYAYNKSTSKYVSEDPLGETTNSDTILALTNGCGLNYQDYKTKYKAMLKSVYENGGFWIARYEAGIDGSDEDSSLARYSSYYTPTLTAVSKKDMIPYNYVTCSQAETLAETMEHDSSLNSSLMFGIQWDLTCKYLEEYSDLSKSDIKSDSDSWGNYYNMSFDIDSTNAKGYFNNSWYTIGSAYEEGYLEQNWVSSYYTESGKYVDGYWESGEWHAPKYFTNYKESYENVLLSTGASERNKALNIYDFAGNESEFTLEKFFYNSSSTYSCTLRGGYFCDRWRRLSGSSPLLLELLQ